LSIQISLSGATAIKESTVKRTLLFVFSLILLAVGCGDDSTSPTTNNTPTNYEMTATTSWFITSPDVDLSKFSSAHIVVSFTSNTSDDCLFNSSPQFQLWSNPDTYDFLAEGAVTINSEPSGTVSPGNIFSYDLTLDLTNLPPNQDHIAMRPNEDNLYGNLGPSKASVSSSDVSFTP
jgi:hypothetical protein